MPELTAPKFTVEDLTIQFSSDSNRPDDTIVVILPCGCSIDIMPRSHGVRGANRNEPFQWKFYCNTHFYE